MSIRATVTLDDDVVERLIQRARSKGVSFGQVVNEVLRAGLLAANAHRKMAPFRVKPRNMGAMPGLNYDSTEALLEFGEGDSHKGLMYGTSPQALSRELHLSVNEDRQLF